MNPKRRIYFWEPWFFLFFGAFHLHRIWALVDRASYARFWMGILQNKGWPYFLIMGVLASLCVVGIAAFLRDFKSRCWWRWIYVLGGAYLLFDLFAIATGLAFWHRLLERMFDIGSRYWNAVWAGFVLLGAIALLMGVRLLALRRYQSRGQVA